MGAYRVLGITMQNGKEEQVYEEFYKFANFAKEDTENRIVLQDMKWKFIGHYYTSSTHDNVIIKGISYNKVTFFVGNIHFKTK